MSCRAWPTLCVLLAALNLSAQENAMKPLAAAHPVPAEKGFSRAQRAALLERGTQRVYTGDARTTLGMPCGGICAGQLYVRGDGTLAGWQVDGGNYFVDTGQTLYRTYRPEQPLMQGFAIAAKTAGGPWSRAILADEGYDAIEFVGEYPRAIVRYRAKDRAVPPVDVDLEVFSPFVPLDARNSAWPATVLRFTVRNPGSEVVPVALGGWLENQVYRERSSPLFVGRRNRAVTDDNVTTVLMEAFERRPPAGAPPRTRVLADFESGTYAGWTLSGDAFGAAPPTGTLPDQQPVSGFGGTHLVNTFAGGDRSTGRLVSEPFRIDLPYLTFRIGGGAHAGQTCLNLVVDGQVVRTATGRNREQLEPRAWDVSPFVRREARLEIVDEHRGGWGHVNVDDIALTNALGPEYGEFRTDALGLGTMALSLLGDGAVKLAWVDRAAFVAGLAARPDTAGGAQEETGEAPLVGTLTTYFALDPGAERHVVFLVTWHFPNLHTGHGRMYTNWFTDARDVAVQLARDLDRLRRETLRFCEVYYRQTTLPWWLNTRLLMPVANLASGTAQWWKNGRFWGWEGVCCCAGTCTHVWNYAQGDAWLFPELARSVRTMQDLGEGFDETSGLVGFRSDRNFAADGQAGTILKCYREHLTSPDDAYLRKHWSRIRAALEYLISHDPDENGVIENDRQHNTYDINFVGPNTFVGALYLAALRAGEEMARLMGDDASATRYRTLFERGRTWTAENLFNGEYYEQRVPPGDDRPWQYGAGCLSDQLFGQNWAHVLGLGYLLPREQVRSGLAAAFKYNWAPDVGPLNERFPPERWFARPGEPGLFVCTWPRGGRPAEPVRYRDEVWTGIEYQLAAGLAWEGLTDEALLIVHGVEERYDGAKHNPWNEIECGDHYARALASWGVRHALAGYTWNGPAGRLSLAPRVQADDFAGFFAAGTAWGTLRQQRTADSQISMIEPAAGRMTVREFQTQVPAGVRVRRVAVAATGAARLEAPFTQDGTALLVRLDAPLALQSDRVVRFEMSW